MEGERDVFPVGMRVLAVDDDPTCLKVLEAMLRQCKYHVTTSNQAVEALKMLRENEDKFDLIITDVHMPDMDGFKLLELVGLEMDLPVIMLSANGDTKAVMKGITHGACDYLLKPVRMEELKNIWQHVIRKKNSASKDHNNSNGGQGPVASGSSDHKQNRKRKDQSEEGDDGTENASEAENATSNKKPKSRVVWTPDLHTKFLDAVRQLGIDKAVPKRILDLMNNDGLTRENVASHLQKYRLYLRKALKEEELSSAFGVRESYHPLAALDNYRDFQTFTSGLPSVQFNGAMSRREPTLLAHNGIRTNSASNLHVSKLHNIAGTQQGSLLQRIPTTMETHRRIQEANINFSGSVSSNGPIASITNNALMLQAQQHNSMHSDSFDPNAGLTSHFPESSVGLLGCGVNSLPVSAGLSPSVSKINCNAMSFSSSDALMTPPTDLVTGIGESSRYVNFGSAGSSQQQWSEPKQDPSAALENAFNSINPPLSGQYLDDVTAQSQRLNGGIYNKRLANANGQMNYSTSFFTQQCKNDKAIADNQMKFKDDFFLDVPTSQGGLTSTGYTLDDIVSSRQGYNMDG